MKEGWKMVKLGEVSSFQNGFAFKSSLFKDKGNPIIRISNIQEGKLSTNGIVYFNPEDYNVDFNQYRIFPNDILIAMSGGTTGKLGINQDNIIYYQNQRVGVIRENPNVLDRQYLYFFLQTKTEESLKIAAGAAQPNLSTAQINNFELPLPPLEEQHRIVGILDAAFAKIDALKANAEANLANAKALFQQVLAQELKPKEGWVKKKLGEVCTKIVDGTHHSPTNTPEGEYPYITAKNIKHNGIDLSNITYVTRDIHREIFSRCNPEKGDVLMIKDGATTGIAVVNDLDFEFSLLSSVALLKTKMEILDPYYLCYVLNSPDVYNQFRSKMDGAAITRITLVKIKDAVIQVPPLEEQHRIVSTLDTLSEKCRRLEQVAQQTIRECDALKQSILRQAFSGKL